MTVNPTAQRFFGAYLQFVDRRDGERDQFLVLPPVTDPELGPRSERFVWWYREQFVTVQRPRWVMKWEHTNYKFESSFKRYEGASWIASEPVIVKVFESEVKRWILADKTPYEFISRLERRARRSNIIIQGPTAKPGVTASPSS